MTFTNEPIEHPEGEDKAFEITVNGTLVWSKLAKDAGPQPVGGHGKPLLMEDNKWWGSADPALISYVMDAISSA